MVTKSLYVLAGGGAQHRVRECHCGALASIGTRVRHPSGEAKYLGRFSLRLGKSVQGRDLFPFRGGA